MIRRLIIVFLVVNIMMFPQISMAESFRNGDVSMKIPEGYTSVEDHEDYMDRGKGDFIIAKGTSGDNDYSLIYHVDVKGRFPESFSTANEGDFLEDGGQANVTRIMDSFYEYYDFNPDETDEIESDDGMIIKLRFIKDDGSDIYAYVRAINQNTFAILYAGNIKNIAYREAATEKAVSDFESMIMSFEDKGFVDYAIKLCKEDADNSIDWNSIDWAEIVGILVTLVLSVFLSYVNRKKKRFAGDTDSGMVTRIDEDLVADERKSDKKATNEKKEAPVTINRNLDQDRLKRMLDEGLITKKEYREMKKSK